MEMNKWRNASKPLQIQGISWGWYLLIFTWFFHMTVSYLLFIIFWLMFLAFLSYKKTSLSLLIGKVRIWLRGNNLTGRPWWVRNNK
ncbi:hypothetical protein NOM68_14410 [Proteus mirabilis]|uniref:hypothetical protein n=1 Tax=Proteus mirabilis TaxID=584 RepID=UPI0021505E20|nr:hypothetical protein [Proteus mirabilis]MCS6722765.1 hypothetical protein [Proteus mirabilis]MCS6729768.1 hypothetical protein [Proteus mirabilis]MCS6748730.1 hypothetical protein [Proteus mirabilis]